LPCRERLHDAIPGTIDRVRLKLPTFPPESAGVQYRLTAD
jgi:hypothetical protein